MSDSAGSKVFEQNDPTEVDQLRAEVADLKAAISSLQAEIADMRAITDGLSDIQGDENVTPGNGFVEFDRMVSKHPVIRFRADRLPSGGGGEYVGGDETNITFVECTDPEDARYGKVMIDVYYV